MDGSADPSEFAKLLRKHLERRGSVPDFAKKVKVDTSFIWHVLNGRRKPPEDMDLWADSLELTGADREVFIIEGGLSRSPAAIQALVRRLWTAPKA